MLSNTTMTRPCLPDLLFKVVDVDRSMAMAAEGVFRHETGRTALEAILVAVRGEFEMDLVKYLQEQLEISDLPIIVDRVRIVDAHPPREVVPAYPDVSAAVSDAERSLNQARAYAAERRFSARAEAESQRDGARTKAARLVAGRLGEKGAFLARVSAHGLQPALTEFRLLWDTLASTLAGRSKVILDQRVSRQATPLACRSRAARTLLPGRALPAPDLDD